MGQAGQELWDEQHIAELRAKAARWDWFTRSRPHITFYVESVSLQWEGEHGILYRISGATIEEAVDSAIAGEG